MPNGKIPTRRRREETESGDCQKELDDLEYEHAMEAEMVGKSYDYITTRISVGRVGLPPKWLIIPEFCYKSVRKDSLSLSGVF